MQQTNGPSSVAAVCRIHLHKHMSERENHLSVLHIFTLKKGGPGGLVLNIQGSRKAQVNMVKSDKQRLWMAQKLWGS